MTTEPSDGVNNQEDYGGISEAISLEQIRHHLFQHHMILKQHDFNMMSPTDRLTLVVINSMSSVFFVTVLVAGLAVVSGLFSLPEVLPYLENVFVGIGMLCLFLIGFMSALQWIVNGAESIRKLREGPPDISDDVDTEYMD